ncbi:MAG: nucleoside triphosphate pyrophosphohydrolase, partial [Actinomycetota bacterium]|nr:nucleoside triphosphate pyrophosphohydrolase [Actinomycetota bacterium]
MPGRLVLLATSPRIPAGLLSAPAWEVLRSADVVCGPPDSPLLPHLLAAGIAVTELGGLSPGESAAVLVEASTGRAERTVVHLGAAEGDDRLGEALAELLRPLADAGDAPEVEILVGSWDPPGARLLDLVAVMDRLRSPGGCPWDAEQTHESLVKYLVEETYETVESIETGD